MPTAFALTFDYLCPFARNAHEHVLVALDGGADLDVTFTPFSLAQSHLEDGAPDVWDAADPDAASGVLALQVGLAVRDELPHLFPAVHRELFAARHDHGQDIKDEAVLRAALERAGADADKVFEIVASGDALRTLAAEHAVAEVEHGVWGVPTWIAGGRAVFTRLMTRPEGDIELATRTVQRVVDLVVDVPELNEFKQVDVPV